VAALQADQDFVGNLIKAATVKTDGASPAHFIMATIWAGGRNFKTVVYVEVIG
jgi:hypothetical protein